MAKRSSTVKPHGIERWVGLAECDGREHSFLVAVLHGLPVLATPVGFVPGQGNCNVLHVTCVFCLSE